MMPVTNTWIRVCQLKDIPVRGTRVIRAESGRIALFRTAEQEVFALDDKCPHKSGPLSQGIVHGHSVTCPLHNWVISLETGKALGADQGQVRTIPLKVVNGTISISTEAVQSANIGCVTRQTPSDMSAVARATNTNSLSTLPRKQGKL
jgi:nitrite reductase (NADH) small subunit